MERLLVSFSGGETSAYMLYWINKMWKDRYDIKFVFANTGEENEETLEFVKKCQEYFGVHVVWVEAVINKKKGVGTTHRVVTFETATRGLTLFMDMSAVYGIPNMSYPHCNRELKLAPIKSYLRSIGWKDYTTAIGIRSDEFDRVSKDRKKNKLIYPLITDQPMTKQHINFWWSQQPFRLNLKGYQGNCKTCWKKSDLKLYTIAKETPNAFDSFMKVEERFSLAPPKSRDKWDGKRITFFRKNRSAKDILKEAETELRKAKDDSLDVDFQTSLLDNTYEESCDIYAECGS